VNRLNALFNRVQYDVLYHPFPQRTFIFSGKYEFGTGAKNQPGIFYTGNEEFFPARSSWFQTVDTKWF